MGKKRKINLDGCSFMPFLDFMARKKYGGVTNAQKIKSNFLSNLWNWTNLYSVVNTNSFVDFLAWLGCR